jgi:hypothetical protein
MLKGDKKYFALKNSKDNSRCVACCVAGILNEYNKKIIFRKPEELDLYLYRKNTNSKKIWQPAAALVLAKYGLKVRMYVQMPASWKRIKKIGLKALDRNVLGFLSKQFDVDKLHEIVIDADNSGVKMFNRGLSDIERIIRNNPNSLCMAGVNPFLLYDIHSRKTGGHYVLVLNANKSHVTISDPGLPYNEKLTISRKNFDLAWKGNSYETGEIIIASFP